MPHTPSNSREVAYYITLSTKIRGKQRKIRRNNDQSIIRIEVDPEELDISILSELHVWNGGIRRWSVDNTSATLTTKTDITPLIRQVDILKQDIANTLWQSGDEDIVSMWENLPIADLLHAINGAQKENSKSTLTSVLRGMQKIFEQLQKQTLQETADTVQRISDTNDIHTKNGNAMYECWAEAAYEITLQIEELQRIEKAFSKKLSSLKAKDSQSSKLMDLSHEKNFIQSSATRIGFCVLVDDFITDHRRATKAHFASQQPLLHKAQEMQTQLKEANIVKESLHAILDEYTPKRKKHLNKQQQSIIALQQSGEESTIELRKARENFTKYRDVFNQLKAPPPFSPIVGSPITQDDYEKATQQFGEYNLRPDAFTESITNLKEDCDKALKNQPDLLKAASNLLDELNIAIESLENFLTVKEIHF